MGLKNQNYLLTLNQRVQGSNPCAPTKSFREMRNVRGSGALPADGPRTPEFCGPRGYDRVSLVRCCAHSRTAMACTASALYS